MNRLANIAPPFTALSPADALTFLEHLRGDRLTWKVRPREAKLARRKSALRIELARSVAATLTPAELAEVLRRAQGKN